MRFLFCSLEYCAGAATVKLVPKNLTQVRKVAVLACLAFVEN